MDGWVGVLGETRMLVVVVVVVVVVSNIAFKS